jgi:hypothetical protein
LRAWQAWQKISGLDEVAGAGYTLLPHVYQNLAGRGATGQELARVKGISRKTWYENQLRLGRLAELVARLRASGIEPMLIRGVAAARSEPDQPGLRNIDDTAFVVRPAQAVTAFKTVAAGGWRPFLPGLVPERHWRYARFFRFCSGDGDCALDLHWHILPAGGAGEADDELWRQPGTVRAGGMTARVLSQTDQLLLACIEGTTWRPSQDWRWVIDALATVQAVECRLDWERLLWVSGQFGYVMPVRSALAFLAQTLEARVPEEVLSQLSGMPTSPDDRRAFQMASRRPGLLGQLPRHWHGYRRWARAAQLRLTPWDFLNYRRTN